MSVISNFQASPPSRHVVDFGFNLKIPRLYENGALSVSRLSLGQSSRVGKRTSVSMALVAERLARRRGVAEPSGILAYDLVQGALVKWSSMMEKSIPEPPTAVLLHGILGSRKNWGNFARRLAQAFPTWQVFSKREVVNALIQEGFSKDVAQWVVTNLRQSGSLGSSSSSYSWVFDLEGIAEMYKSYEETNLWKFVDNLPRGVHVNFLKAERSLHRWALEDIQRILAAEEFAVDGGGGVEMHVLEDAGHWVHADNPDGLFRIFTSSFQGF